MKVLFSYFIYLSIFNIVCHSRYIEEDDGSILLPVQHIQKENGHYVTYKDVQAGDDSQMDEEEAAKKLNCIPKNEEGPRKTKESEETGKEIEDNMFVFNDTTPFNGTDVNEIMEVRIIRPLCDD